MTIDCTKWRELASDYTEGTLPKPMQEAISLHLAGCAACREEEVMLRGIYRELNVLPEVDTPLFFRENVMSAIEREGTRPAGAWWQSLLPNYSRLAIGTGLAACAIAALTFAVLAPKSGQTVQTQTAGQSAQALLASSQSPVAVRSGAPSFVMSRITTVIPGDGAAYDFTFHLQNADSGTARFAVGEDARQFRFALKGSAPQTLRVSPAMLTGKKVLELSADWSVNQASHTRQMFVPIAATDTTPEAVQSFGLPEGTLADVARELSVRYGQAITLDDVSDTKVRLTMRDETLESGLHRELAPLGLTVTSTPDGLHIGR